MRGFLAQPPSVWTLMISLLSRVSARLTEHLKYSEVLILKIYAKDLHVAVLSLPALKPRPQEIRWLLLSLKSSALAMPPSVAANNVAPRKIFNKCFIRIMLLPIFLR